ncbi:v-snare protein [Grosmannia clavigera kw1407]|uniref:Protein transport protein BOS1 n=1 Tax=Grosmannia clavigera (strain kw1407 / UAMH 11150) TaxID=655863 RepID=F0XCB4_GROCL|nr:v-snare protein [Grosmannia clavigera kw1407]EFX04344.1 v-snare protein [Grosmannia clavigera kw1407]
MNTAFNGALKQSTAIRKDLSSLSAVLSNPSADDGALVRMPAAFGQLSASLTTFSRTVDEYNSLAKQELNPAKQEKAFDRIRNFRTELGEYRTQLESLKSSRDDAVQAQSRAELLGRRPYVTATPENPYASAATAAAASAGGGGPASSSIAGAAGLFGHARTMSASERAEITRETHALREQNFFSNTNTALDEYIARGQAVLGDLGSQRDMLKNTQKRMYTVANTLGISGDTIRMIERRAREDKWIFWTGVVIFVLFCWLCLHYLR